MFGTDQKITRWIRRESRIIELIKRRCAQVLRQKPFTHELLVGNDGLNRTDQICCGIRFHDVTTTTGTKGCSNDLGPGVLTDKEDLCVWSELSDLTSDFYTI